MGSIYRRKYKDKKTGKMKESTVWWISYYRNGVKMRESSESDKISVAKETLKKREGAIADGVPISPSMTRVKFKELATDVVNDYKMNDRASMEETERRFRLHILPRFGERRASAISTADLVKFVTERKDEKASNAEINRELAAIKRAFSLAVKSGKVLSRPHIPMLKENNVRKGFFERAEFELLRCLLPRALQGLMTFAYITGWRIKSEVLGLEWRQVDFKAGTVRLDPGTTKNDEARVFPFTAELRTVLEAQKQEAEGLQKKGRICPYVFHRNGRRIRDFRRSWELACSRAGVPDRIPHDFRRSAVRNLVRAGVPERVAMQMTGHKTRSVFERYNIVSEGDLQTAARLLDAFSESTGTVTGTVSPIDRKAKTVSP